MSLNDDVSRSIRVGSGIDKLVAKREATKKHLQAEREKMATAVERIEQLRKEQNTLTGSESEKDRTMLVGRVDGLQMALNILAALQEPEVGV